MINEWWKKNCTVFYDAYDTCSKKQRKYISKICYDYIWHKKNVIICGGCKNKLWMTYKYVIQKHMAANKNIEKW